METRARYVLMGLFTTAVILAGFGFVYWLNSVGGLGERSYYEVRFDQPVPGLRPSSAVLFNGIRVGEVTSLRLRPDQPDQAIASISVEKATPVRADTVVGIDFQGLMGGASLSLKGGSAGSPILLGPRGAPPTLVADRKAAQDMTQAAREVLGRLDTILAENAEDFRSTMANLRSFTSALARNSGRIDGLVSGLESMAGVGPPKPSPVIYDLTAPGTFPPSEKPVGGQLAVAEPTSLVLFDTQRILRRPGADGSPAFPNAQWSDSLPKLLQAKVVQILENSGRLSGVGRTSDGFTADYQLLLDLRKFQISTADQPRAEVEFSAKLVGDGGRILGMRTFQASIPTAADDAGAAAAALDEAFGRTATDLVAWVTETI